MGEVLRDYPVGLPANQQEIRYRFNDEDPVSIPELFAAIKSDFLAVDDITVDIVADRPHMPQLRVRRVLK